MMPMMMRKMMMVMMRGKRRRITMTMMTFTLAIMMIPFLELFMECVLTCK